RRRRARRTCSRVVIVASAGGDGGGECQRDGEPHSEAHRSLHGVILSIGRSILAVRHGDARRTTSAKRASTTRATRATASAPVRSFPSSCCRKPSLMNE